jgi:hypothetical protein
MKTTKAAKQSRPYSDGFERNIFPHISLPKRTAAPTPQPVKISENSNTHKNQNQNHRTK